MILLMPPATGVFGEYPEDICRIMRVCREAGYEVGPMTAKYAWETESNDFSAHWLYLPADDSELLERVVGQLEEVK